MRPDQPAFKFRVLRMTLNFELGFMNIDSTHSDSNFPQQVALTFQLVLPIQPAYL